MTVKLEIPEEFARFVIDDAARGSRSGSSGKPWVTIATLSASSWAIWLSTARLFAISSRGC